MYVWLGLKPHTTALALCGLGSRLRSLGDRAPDSGKRGGKSGAATATPPRASDKVAAPKLRTDGQRG